MGFSHSTLRLEEKMVTYKLTRQGLLSQQVAVEVARRVNGCSFEHQDVKLDGDIVRVSGVLVKDGKVFETDPVVVEIVWLDGVRYHGRVTATFSNNVFACWEGSDQQAHIASWKYPPLSFQYWHKYGLRWPRNRRNMRGRRFEVIVLPSLVAASTYIALWMIFMLTLSYLMGVERWVEASRLIFSIASGAAGVIAGSVLTGFVQGALLGVRAREWECAEKSLVHPKAVEVEAEA